MNFIQNIMITVGIVLAHWFLGQSLLLTLFKGHILSRKFNSEMNFLHVILLGSLGLFIFSLLQVLVPHNFFFPLFIFILLLSFYRGGVYLYKKKIQFKRPNSFNLCFYSMLGLLAMAALYVLSQAALPGPFNAGYGDLPAFYRVANNLYHKSTPLIDFTVLDFPDGFYGVPLYSPFHVLFQSLLLNFMPLSVQGMSLYSFIFTLLFFILLKNFYQQYIPKLNSLWAFTLLLIPWFLNRNMIHLFFCYPNASGPFYLLFLFYLAANKSKYTSPLWWTFFCYLILSATLARPENIILLAVFFFCWFVLNILFKWEQTVGKISLGIFLLSFVGFFIFVHNYPTFIDNLASGNYVWNSTLNSFRFNDLGLFASNYSVSNKMLGLPDPLQGQVSSLSVHVFEHPFLFFKFLFVSSFIQLGLLNDGLIFLSLFLGIYIFIKTKTKNIEHLSAALTFVLFPSALFLANCTMTSRHLLPYFVMLAIFLIIWTSQISNKKKDWGDLVKKFLPTLMSVIILFWTFFQFQVAFRIQLGDTSFKFLYIQNFFDHLSTNEKNKKPLVATTYPQVSSYLSNLPSVGGTFLRKHIIVFLKKYKPDILVLDNSRPEPGAHLLKEYFTDEHLRNFILKNYNEVEGSNQLEYKIFKKMAHDLE